MRVGKVCGFAVHLASENPNKKLEKLKKKMRKKQRGDGEECVAGWREAPACS